MRIAAIAVEYRQRFHSDVVVDLIGYRRYGHNESDDPTVTQPRRYAIIKDRAPLSQLYAKEIGVDPTAELKAVQDAFFAEQKTGMEMEHRPHMAQLPSYWDGYNGGELSPEEDEKLETGIPAERVLELAQRMTKLPENFNVHPKVKKLYEQRVEMGEGKRRIRIMAQRSCWRMLRC